MTESQNRDFVRYLDAKRSVDDRSIDRRVWDRLRAELSPATADAPLCVAELGAGTGTGLERMLARDLLPPRVSYVGVDLEAATIARARARHAMTRPGLEVAFAVDDLHALAAARGNHQRFDLVVCQALLDVLDLEVSLPALLRLLRPGGLLYAPITFDGETLFEPGLADDEYVLARYHAPTARHLGDSRTGRRLFHALQRHPADILEVASSDWVVYPRAHGYADDEAYFLRFLIATIEDAVTGMANSEPARIRAWAAARYRQIERGELVYIAHQLDFLIRKS